MELSMKKLSEVVKEFFGKSRLDERYPGGSPLEVCNPQPVEVPLRFQRPPTMEERIRQFIRSEAMRREAEAQGAETFEEADDFEVDDPDFDVPSSEFEVMELEPQDRDAAPPAEPTSPQPPAAAPGPAQGAGPSGTPPAPAGGVPAAPGPAAS
ncbi:hypothetical protein [Apis mellifera associated microvirus 50]|nr:hypothetical protein [Apis mellifera associated microvirus 50]